MNFVRILKSLIGQPKKREHSEFIWKQIYILRKEIVDEVLIGHSKNRIPIRTLKLKAALIKKYSRRLKLLKA